MIPFLRQFDLYWTPVDALIATLIQDSAIVAADEAWRAYIDSRPHVNSIPWIQDCKRFYGRTLIGAWSHYCPDWDFLAIDETCPEMEGCCCSFVPKYINIEAGTKLLDIGAMR